MIKTLLMLAYGYNNLTEYKEDIEYIRNKVIYEYLSEKEQAAISWINEMFEMKRLKSVDERFFEASKALLIKYPMTSNKKMFIEDLAINDPTVKLDCTLINHWISTFGEPNNIFDIYVNILHKKLPNNRAERLQVYKLLGKILRKLIVLYNRNEKNNIRDYLRICKNYLVAKVLANETSIESSEFSEKLFSGFKNYIEADEYNKYDKILNEIATDVVYSELGENILYAGFTNYWDIILEELVENNNKIVMLDDTLKAYINVLNKRPLNRRLLQMFLYGSVKYLYAKDVKFDNTDLLLAIEKTKFVTSDVSDLEIYLLNIIKVANIIAPTCGELISKIYENIDDECVVDQLDLLYFIINNKIWNKLVIKLNINEIDLIKEVAVPCILLVQNDIAINNIVEYYSYESAFVARIFLNNQNTKNILGEFYINYYNAICSVNSSEYELANKYVQSIDNCPPNMKYSFKKLIMAINEKSEVNKSEMEEIDKVVKALPKFSFMNTLEPNGDTLYQLKNEFDSNNSYYNDDIKCIIAKKIYFYLTKGEHIPHINEFIYKWGFCAIKCQYNIEHKAEMLFELLDNIHCLGDNFSKFKNDFINQYIYILNEYEFNVLQKKISRINEYYNKIYSKFSPFNEELCYASVLEQLSKLINLSHNEIEATKLENNINAIKNELLEIHAKYTMNYFAKKSLDFVEEFKRQLIARGIYEVLILNENSIFNGSVFFQIKNMSLETKTDVSITMYLKDIKNTIQHIRLKDILPNGLRPNQIYAGEYIPGIKIEEGKEIICIIQIENDNDAYIAVDHNSGGRLVARFENYIYEKDFSSGYNESTITIPEYFVKRERKINEIISGIGNYDNIVLYGTNGTGKSSILNYLENTIIPNSFKPAICINISFNDDTNASEVINGLLDIICKNNSKLIREIRVLTLDETNREKTYARLSNAYNVREESKAAENLITEVKIIEILEEIGQGLAESGIRLFILWDNFEKIISSIDANKMDFLRTCSEKAKIKNNITFIFSGSNYLLEAVGIERGDDSWNRILVRGTNRIKIGNLFGDEFNKFMSQKRSLNNGEIHYSEEAIKYLWQYTNGHALYSVVLGNRVLDILNSKHVNRHCIYSSDIIEAIYGYKHYSVDTSKEIAIKKQIFQDISDNISVKYTGSVLARYITKGQNKMSYANLRDVVLHKRSDISEADLDYAVNILKARDFIYSPDEKDPNYPKEQIEYLFTSDLYLEHFYDIDIPEQDIKIVKNIEKDKKDIFDEFSNILRKASVQDIPKLKAIMGNISIGTNIEGGSFTTNNFQDNASQIIANVQINVQNIIKALNNISLTNTLEENIGYLQQLPRLSSYIDKDDLISFENLDYEKEPEKAALAESKLSEATQKMTSSYVTAMLSQNDNIKEFCIWEILGIKKDDYYDLIEVIDVSFVTDLYFAAKLDSIFDIAIKDKKITVTDYSPVSIMYCKVFEKMLKFYHTDIYINRLPSSSTKVFFNNKETLFGDLKFDLELKHKTQNKITIGAFLYPIYKSIFVENHDILPIISGSNDRSIKRIWKQHAELLNNVKNIRNNSAHGAEGIIIDYDTLIVLKKMLLAENGLLNLVKLRLDFNKVEDSM